MERNQELNEASNRENVGFKKLQMMPTSQDSDLSKSDMTAGFEKPV